MTVTTDSESSKRDSLRKTPTGITGLDEITFGGLPTHRTSLICGGAGCGKTLMAMEFIVRGITQFNEPGLFVTFEETADELAENVASLGFDVDKLTNERRLAIEHIEIQRGQIEENGEYDLEGLFVRLNYAIDSIGAKRVAIDTIESLFSGFENEIILRAELNRLFDWLKQKGVTSVITGEQGRGTLTRFGLEEYVSDCVIFLDHRVEQGITTRRLRIVKYRGSFHGTNEYPFLIDRYGIGVLPITSIGLTHSASKERLSTGVPGLDEMLGGKGFYRGSSILISGLAGTGKTTFAAHFAAETCRRGEKNLYFGFEESLSQFVRNMESIGLDFRPWIENGLFKYHAARPTLYGLESHLVSMYREIELFKPSSVSIDPMSTFLGSGTSRDVKSMLMRLMDLLKSKQITALFTSLLHNEHQLESTDVGVSSLMDTWILLRTIENNGERNRAIHVLKSRGMDHSNQVREYRFTAHGIELEDVYIGPGGVLTGSARVIQEARDAAAKEQAWRNQQRRRSYIQVRKNALEAQIAALRAEYQAQELQIEQDLEAESLVASAENQTRKASGKSRTQTSFEGSYDAGSASADERAH